MIKGFLRTKNTVRYDCDSLRLSNWAGSKRSIFLDERERVTL
jgi:hypothetical protein